MDATTGAVQKSLTPVTSGRAAGIISNNFLFLYGDQNVESFSVNTLTGALTPVPGSPFTALTDGTYASGLAVDPAGKFLFVPYQLSSQVVAFTINSSGQLTTVPGSPFAAGTFPSRPADAIVDPSGKFLYVSLFYDPTGGIAAYTINPSTGVLTPMLGSPFSTLTNGGPTGLAVHPNGKFLYIAMSGPVFSGPSYNQIVAESIDTSTGALSPVPGSPFAAGGSAPGPLAMDPTGKFLYCGNSNTGFNDATVSAFTVDASTGGLTPISGSPYSTGGSPSTFVVNSTSAVLYASIYNSNVLAFTIGRGGALTQVAPINAPTNGVAIVHQH